MRHFGKRFDGPAGRRTAPREAMLVPAWISTLSSSTTIEMLNISATGAKLRGERLPDKGAELFIRAGALDMFAVVAWRCRDLCGITFDQPVERGVLAALRAETQFASVYKLSPEERLAAEDWSSGFAR